MALFLLVIGDERVDLVAHDRRADNIEGARIARHLQVVAPMHTDVRVFLVRKSRRGFLAHLLCLQGAERCRASSSCPVLGVPFTEKRTPRPRTWAHDQAQ